MKKIVITGATSSLGTALIDECIRQNIKVLALVNPNSMNIKRITVHPLVTIQECELTNLTQYECNGKFDAFIHLAWGATHGEAARNQYEPQVQNIQYCLDAVKLAERLGCEVFVGAGSQAEYGRTNEILTEKTATNPETPYGIAKLCAGQMTRLMCREKGIRHIWPRILSTYGPRYTPDTVINYTINELLRGNVPVLSGGDQIWDFIFSEDVAKALYLLAEKGHDGEVYVIGSGHSEPLKNYLYKVRDIIDPKLQLGLGQKPYSSNAVMHLACDISKLTNDTGFYPSVSFEDGIVKTIEWNKANYIGV